jgi:hypothetical protein
VSARYSTVYRERAEVSEATVDDAGHGHVAHSGAVKVEEPGRADDICTRQGCRTSHGPDHTWPCFLLVETGFSNAKTGVGRFGVSRLRTVVFEQRLRLLA